VATFKRRDETSRKIALLDEYGNRRYVLQYGRMNQTKHQRVLSVLEKRALRYRSKFSGLEDLHSGDNIDETGTVSTEGLTDSESDCDSDSISFNNNKSIRQSEIDSIKGLDEVPKQRA
jgi:hypothetical protein